MTLDYSGTWGARCPEDTDHRFYWCHVVSDSDYIDYREDELLWRGGLLQLVDVNGGIVAQWQPS